MDIYSSWIPNCAYYAVHLLLWMLPIIMIQWIAFGRILWPNRLYIFSGSAIIGFYLCLTDILAVRFGVWHFDEELILGISPGGVPIEEWAFFFLTALLVAQSFILFLPDRLRRKSPAKEG